ncbi:Ribosome-binding protein 1, putative [Babesia ovata]|uniref:Ribosome-binding protein 1, putative n=1 Tax=Babesia ovata TaxID=189622 RepID=A0A2H6KDG3_9APIC|nr:Ribosome-binding protein 1, putative [Babesia ovata]GBE61033.1 Ribosome-binding protein 1, putative [Babesia ovata]
MATHNIQLGTLKECLQFLMWLNHSKQSSMKTDVATQLSNRLEGKYNTVNPTQIASALSTFLSSVSNFHKKLCKTPMPGNYVGKDATAALDALLECIPKFLAVMYFLRYNVDANFAVLGGGKWANNQVGRGILGGEADKYLTEQYSSKYGVIPGGFGRGEIKYDPRRGYSPASKMATDLINILNKRSVERNVQNYFLDVFSTSVLPPTSGTQDSNTANALALVRTFCEIVGKEKDGGGDLIKTLNTDFKSSDKRICWDNLKDHCEKLKRKFGNIFTSQRFSFTGFGRESQHLKKEEFAKDTARWLRDNLDKVKTNLGEIKTGNAMKNTAEYFTKNLFSFGFTFNGSRFDMREKGVEALKKDWRDVINEFKNPKGDLDRLREILSGTYTASCPPPPPKKPEAPPAKVPEAPKEVVPEKKVPVPKKPEVPPAKVPEVPKKPVPETKVPVTPPKKPEVPPEPTKTDNARPVATKTEAAKPVVTKAEAAKPTATKTEGNQNQGKKAEGAQNQGKKGEGTPNQGSGQGGDTSSGPTVLKAPATTQPPGDQGGTGPAGPPVTASPTSPKSTGSPVRNAVQVQQNTSQDVSVLPPPPPPPPLPGGDGPAAPPGPSGQDSASGVSPTIQTDSPQAPVLTKPTSVTGSGAASPGDQGTRQDSGQGVGQQVSPDVSSVTNVSVAPASGGSGGDHSQKLQKSSRTCKDGKAPAPVWNAKRYMCPEDRAKPTHYIQAANKPSPEFWNKVKAAEEQAERESRKAMEQYERIWQQQRDNAAFLEGSRITIPKPRPSMAIDAVRGQVLQDGSDIVLQKQKEANDRWTKMHDEALLQDVQYDAFLGKEIQENNPTPPWQLKPSLSYGNAIRDLSRADSAFHQSYSEGINNVNKQYQAEKKKQDDIENKAIAAGEQLHTIADIVESVEQVVPASKSLVKDPYFYNKTDFMRKFKNESHIWGAPITSSTGAMPTFPILPPALQKLQDDGPQFDGTVVPPNTPPSNVIATAPLAEIYMEVEKPERFVQHDPVMETPDDVLETFLEPPDDVPMNLPPVPDEVVSLSMDPDEIVDDLPTSSQQLFDFDLEISKLKERTHAAPPVPIAVFPGQAPDDLNRNYCQAPWYVAPSSTTTITPPPSPPPDSDHLPPPNTVREMLHWMVGMSELGYVGMIAEHLKILLREINEDVSQPPDALEVTRDPYNLDASIVSNTLTQACLYGASVIHKMKYNDSNDAPTTLNFSSEYSKLHYSSDPARLLCQLRDYVYACYYQLRFLRSQCSRVQLNGGWQDCRYGHKVHNSPLQAFLTDTSKFETHPFDPCDICLKSRVVMGFEEKDLPKVSKSLGKYIVDLDKWIVKTKKDIEAAQDLVQKILDEVNGNADPNNLENLNNAIHKVESELDGRAADLTKWKEAAKNVLTETITSSTSVHEKLDPNKKKDPGATEIGKGLQQITTAKEKVEGVDRELIKVHSNLHNWNSAAKGVLNSVVSKATDVHKRLQHDGQDTIGKNIKNIGDAKTQLDTANGQLQEQVTKLGTWITDAEKIRQAAEDKAKEAYDKLKVNETLSKNVEQIVNANKAIQKVNKNLETVHSNLGEWNKEAKSVLAGAIKNAQTVHDALEDKDDAQHPVAQNINKISSNSQAIQNANTELGQHVKSLEQWKTAAQNVISKAEGKCDDILTKVKTDGTAEGKIYKQAQELQKKGTELYNAASEAKRLVGQKVGEALEAVVQMDKSLKTDLKEVKDEIKEGIKKVIEELKVTELDQKVKNDLKTLRKKISELGKKPDLASSQLQELGRAKGTLEETTGTDGSIQKALISMDEKFKSEIQQKLNDKVSEVDQAIERLGEKFTGLGTEEQKKLEEIFKHIHKQLGEIRGEQGQQDERESWKRKDAKGLLGIESAIQHYFNAFSGDWQFDQRVTGWTDDILGHNGLVKRLLGWQSKPAEQLKTELNQNGLAGGIREPLKAQIEQAVLVFKSANADGIQQKITQVKDACELFARRLEEKLEKDVNSGVLEITKKAKDALNSEKLRSTKGNLQAALAKANCNCGNCRGSKCLDCTYQTSQCVLIQAIATTVVVVSSVARQVSKEVDSLMLADYRMGTGMNIAKALDQAVKATKKLDEQLDEATQKSTDPKESPAKAVDSRLGEVRNMVERTITDNFKNNVKQPLADAVSQLPTAVTQFNPAAVDQIKQAAKAAIQRAAGEISGGDNIVSGKRNGLMSSFEEAQSEISQHIQNRLDGEVDNTIVVNLGTDRVTITNVNSINTIITLTARLFCVQWSTMRCVATSGMGRLMLLMFHSSHTTGVGPVIPFCIYCLRRRAIQTLYAGNATWATPYGIASKCFKMAMDNS